MSARLLLAAANAPQGPTTELTGTSAFSRWQYELILYTLIVAMVALFAAGVYSIATKSEISKKYRPAAMASTLINWVAAIAYLILVVTFFTHWHPNANGTTYLPEHGTIFTGLRYADWTVTVPLLCVELLAVCTIARSAIAKVRAASMACAFLMIALGFFGVIALGENNASSAELLIWGGISGFFWALLYPLLLRPVFKTVKQVGEETGKSLRRAAIGLLAVWFVYPLVYLIPLWAGDHSSGWATTAQLAFCCADIAAKAGFGAAIHKVAKLRTAEDADEPAAAVPDTYPAEVYVSGHEYSLPRELATVGAARGNGNGTGNGSHADRNIADGPGSSRRVID